MRISFLILVVLQLFCWQNVKGQKTYKLHLMNGKILEVVDFEEISLDEVRYKFDKNYFKRERIQEKNARIKSSLMQDLQLGKLDKEEFEKELQSKSKDLPEVELRQGMMDTEEIFAVRNPDDIEKLYYSYDEEGGNYLSIPEMKMFINGERDARENYRGRGYLYSGVAVGLAAGYLETSIYTLAVPFVFALGTKIPPTKIKEKYISDVAYYGNENYASGFHAHARSVKALQGLKGSAIGIAVGMIVYSVVDANR